MTPWSHVEAALNGILDRRWYTNHGPLARMLEAEWAEASGRTHAVAVVNPTIGLIMVAEALALSGDVLLSALAPPRCAQALTWAGLRPRFCDIDPDTLGWDCPAAEDLIDGATCAFLGTPGTHAATLAALGAIYGRPVFGDSLGGLPGPTMIDLPALGDDAGAACILTDDDRIAARLRNIRSSYGAGHAVAVTRTANGRLSEAQAGMALLHSAGRTATALLVDLCRPLLGDSRIVPYGSELLIVGETATRRSELICELQAAGFETRRIDLHSSAADCPAAHAVTERAVAIRPGPSRVAH